MFGSTSVPLSTSWRANVPGVPSQQNTKPNGNQNKGTSGLKAKKQVILEDDDEEIGDDAEEYENFASVSTTALETFGLAPHPSPVCEAATLSSVPSPECTYSLKLPSHVLKSGAISALQFHAVRLACARHEQKLPDGSRAGFFLGDGPGVGKGRQIAATIFNYFCRGKTRALWVSVSSDLVVDARRDLEALGMLEYDAVRLHDLRQLKARKGKPLASLSGLDSGILFCTYDLLVSGATNLKKAAKVKALSRKSSAGSSAPFGDENLPPWERAASPEDGADDDDEAAAEFGPQSRLHQIVEWLGDGDYVIVLDECHKAKNCIPKEAKENAFPLDLGQDSSSAAIRKTPMQKNHGVSKTARAVIELQRRCPNARVMYVSATGASEAENLCYMERLGLWGVGSAFPTKAEFVALLKQGGIGAMELVAMELKGAGCYLSRALSWADVQFETVAIDASPEFVAMYDAAVSVWQDTRQFLVDHEMAGGARWGHQSPMSQFYAAQLRFFRQLCTAAKVDTVVRLCQEALDKGMCPVIGLQSTGEARTAEYVAAMAAARGANDDEDLNFDNFVEPAALILSSFIERNLMHEPGASVLLQRAKTLVLPKNPLDDLIDRLGGPDNVAEMTGRNKRMERDTVNGGYKYVRRTEYYGGCSLDDVNILERAAFQEGRKQVAIISDAASAGISLHADKGAKNTRQRVQITLELAWSADKTVQQLGRTHRSNQLHPPIYKIVSTNICGEHRFASAVAHRLQQLGALTQGDRRAASASEAMAAFNLQTKWAREALRSTLNIIQSGGNSIGTSYESISPPWLEEMMREGLPADQDPPEPGSSGYIIRREAVLRRWCASASLELAAVGLDGSRIRSGALNINTVLNRLLGMRVAMQAQVFGYFSAIMDKVVSNAKKDGTYDATGIIKPCCDNINLRSSKVVCEHPNGAAATSHTVFDMDRGIPFSKAKKLLDDELDRVRKEQGDAAADLCGAGFYYSDSATTRYFCLALPRNERGTRPVTQKGVSFKRANYFRIVRPVTGVGMDVAVSDFRTKCTRITSLTAVEREWNRAYEEGADKRKVPLHLITGSVLPLLKTITGVLNKFRDEGGRMRRLQLMRVETSGQNLQRFIGVLVPREVILSYLLDAIKKLEHLTPEQKFRKQQADQNKKSAADKMAAAAAMFGVKPPPAAAAACSDAAAAAPEIDPSVAAGMDPAVLQLLQQSAQAVQTSAALLGEAPAAAAAGSSAAAAVDADGDRDQDDAQEDGDAAVAADGSSSSDDDDDDESLHARRRRRPRRPVRKGRITRADVAAAERAAAAAARTNRSAAAAEVVTEGLAAAGLWEDGGDDLTFRSGGAAAAGGGGTRWQKFAAAGSSKAGSRAAAAAGGGRGSRGRRAKAEKWMVSDDFEDDSADEVALDESSDLDLAAADGGESSDHDDDDVSLISDDDQAAGRRRQPARQARPRRQQQQYVEEDKEVDDDLKDDQSPDQLPDLSSWGAKRKRSGKDGSSSGGSSESAQEKITAAAAAAAASLAAAGVDLSAASSEDAAAAVDEEQQMLDRKQRRMRHPAAKQAWLQQQQQQEDAEAPQQQEAAAAAAADADPAKTADDHDDDHEEDDDNDEGFRSVDDLPDFRPNKKAKKTSNPAAAAAEDDNQQENLCTQPVKAAATAAKRSGRPPKAAADSSRKSSTRAAAAATPITAAATGAGVSVSSRGRIRKPKLLPDDYVSIDLDHTAAAAAAQQQRGAPKATIPVFSDSDDDVPQEEQSGTAAAAAAEAGDVAAQQEQQQQQAQPGHGATADNGDDDASAPAAATEADDDAAAATVADGEADGYKLTPQAAAAADDLTAEAVGEDAGQEPPAAAAAAAAGEHQADVAADRATAAQQQQQQQPDRAASPAANTPCSPPAAAVPDQSDLRSKVVSVICDLTADLSPGEPLSVKSVRLAVEATTGWKLTPAMRKLLKDICQEWQQQQLKQQQQQKDLEAPQPEEQQQDVDESKLTEVVKRLLANADLNTLGSKSLRLAAAAELGLDDIPKGPLRDLIKKITAEHITMLELQQQQQQQEDATAADVDGAEDDAIEEDEGFRSVDDLPDFRPSKKNKSKTTRPPAAAAKVTAKASAPMSCEEDDDDQNAAAAAKGGSSRVSAARSRRFARFNQAVAAAASAAIGTIAAATGKKRQQQHDEDDLHDDDNHNLMDDLEPAEGEEPAAAGQQTPAAAASGSSKRRRLRHASTPPAAAAAADANMDDLEDPDLVQDHTNAAAAADDDQAAAAAASAAAAAMPDIVLADVDAAELMDELMEDLSSPKHTTAAAAAGDAAAAGSDVRGVSPIPADLFNDSPSPLSQQQQQQGTTESAAAATATGGRGTVSRAHRRAVIADSDDEDDTQQQQQQQQQQTPAEMPPTAATASVTPAAAAAAAAAPVALCISVSEPLRTADGALVTADFVAALQQQLAAAAAQIAELQQQHEEQQAAAAVAREDADMWKNECQQLKQQLESLKQQQQQQEDVEPATAMQVDNAEALGSPSVALKPTAAAAATPVVEQVDLAAAAAAATPAAATPLPWCTVTRSDSTAVATATAATAGGGAVDDNPPTPRMGCLDAAATAAVTPAAVAAVPKFDAAAKSGLQQQQQQVPATPVTPGSDLNASTKQQQQQQKQSNVVEDHHVTDPITIPTLDDVRSWLQENPKGATAVQILKAFSSNSSSKGLSSALCDLLQQLVDDLEVIRKGGAAASSSTVDMADCETMFIPLC